MTHVLRIGAAVDRHHHHVDREVRHRVDDSCGVLRDPAGVQRPGRQRRAGSVCRNGVPELAVRREGTVLDGQWKLAHLIDWNDAVVSWIRDTGKFRAVGEAWEFLADQIESRQTREHIRASKAKSAAA